MSDKINPNKITNEVLLADAMIRITALERLLIKKGLLITEELQTEIDEISVQVSDAIMKSMKEVPTIDELISQLSGENKDKN